MKWRSLEESTQATESRSLREIYAERKKLIAKYVPADIQAAHARVVEELKQSGIADRALKPGDPAHDFELNHQSGELVRSCELLECGPLVICFFRGRWCPFCVGQMQAMNAVVPQMQELGASLVGISPQTVHQSFLMADQHKLQFPLLSDSANRVAKRFGVVYRVPDFQQEIYSRAFVNLPFINGDSSWELPIPATYILNTNHRAHRETQREEPQREPAIVYASADPDYTNRPEPANILHTLAQSFS
jgi:peroxiredoxin